MRSRRVETLSDDALAWVWAHLEQLKLLDAHDAFWANTARNGWDRSNLRAFVRAYSVGRGVSGKYIYENLQPIADHLDQKFRACGNSLIELNGAWLESIEFLQEQNDGYSSASFCSKLLWFYRPEAMFMYDQNVLSALRSASKTRIPLERYSEEMETQFCARAGEIDAAAAHFERAYPYKRRILDKWLWLKGSRGRSDKLQKFRSSLAIAPWPL